MNEMIISSERLPANVSELSQFVLVGRDKLTAVRAAIRAIDKVGVAADVYQQKLEEAQEIAEAVLDAEVRLGELRKEVPREKNQYTSAFRTDANSTSRLQDFDEKAHIKKDEAARFETMASHPDIVEQTKARARENGEIVTRQAVLDAIKTEKRQRLRDERRKAIARQVTTGGGIDLESPLYKYRVIYADPPWQYDDKQDVETLGGAAKHYKTMSLEQICALPVPAEDNAVLFLWTTSPLLSFKVINAWGFRYKSSFIWDKVRHNTLQQRLS